MPNKRSAQRKIRTAKTRIGATRMHHIFGGFLRYKLLKKYWPHSIVLLYVYFPREGEEILPKRNENRTPGPRIDGTQAVQKGVGGLQAQR
jgi:hypothetical protein